jgi:hypothetical protein
MLPIPPLLSVAYRPTCIQSVGGEVGAVLVAGQTKVSDLRSPGLTAHQHVGRLQVCVSGVAGAPFISQLLTRGLLCQGRQAVTRRPVAAVFTARPHTMLPKPSSDLCWQAGLGNHPVGCD